MNIVFDIIFLLSGVWFLFKVSDFKIKIITLAFLYPLFPITFISYGFKSLWIIDDYGLEYYGEYLEEAKYLAYLFFLTYAAVIFPYRNKQISFKVLQLSFFLRCCLLLLIFITAINSYPKAFFLTSYRWNLINIGNTQVLYLAFTVLFLLSSKRIFLLEAIHIGILVFLSARGERAENMFTLVYYMVFVVNRIKQKNTIFIWASLVLLFLGISGEIIRAEDKEMTFAFFGERLIRSLFFQSTCTDVVHVYLSSIYYYKHVGFNFNPLINEVMSFIPLSPLGGAGGSYNFTEILRKTINNPGGGLFFTEGIVLLGPFGGWVYSLIFGLIIRSFYIYSQKYGIWAILGVLIVILPIRVLWYGFVYIPSTFVVTCFLYLFFNYLKRFKYTYEKKTS